jgi:hypothetical protein
MILRSPQSKRTSPQDKTARTAAIIPDLAPDTPAAYLGRSAARVNGLEIGMKRIALVISLVQPRLRRG